ncbi:uncharacterized protein [Typha angustifolia]|uniref:uncharacterized protein n=1 Tax=Typha angustifolia TaxID=59011 RepID=UPI003C2EB793
MSPSMAKKRNNSIFSLGGCGCKSYQSVSLPVSISDTSDESTPNLRKFTNLSSASTSSSCEEVAAGDDADVSGSNSTFSGLLRQLSELERSVLAFSKTLSAPPLPPPPPPPPLPPPSRLNREGIVERKKKKKSHRRSKSEGGGRVEESVAVVKESEDPLADFRRSMLQMIIENEIVTGEELRRLLGRFLTLNSPQHHGLILRAFAEIWEDVFLADGQSPEFFRPTYYRRYPPPRRL